MTSTSKELAGLKNFAEGIHQSFRDRIQARSDAAMLAAPRSVTPDELALLGRPHAIRRSLTRAAAMRPDLAESIERLASHVTPCDDEARYWALKIVWTRGW